MLIRDHASIARRQTTKSSHFLFLHVCHSPFRIQEPLAAIASRWQQEFLFHLHVCVDSAEKKAGGSGVAVAVAVVVLALPVCSSSSSGGGSGSRSMQHVACSM